MNLLIKTFHVYSIYVWSKIYNIFREFDPGFRENCVCPMFMRIINVCLPYYRFSKLLSSFYVLTISLKGCSKFFFQTSILLIYFCLDYFSVSQIQFKFSNYGHQDRFLSSIDLMYL